MTVKLFELCYLTRKHDKSVVMGGVYNLQKPEADLALERARKIGTKAYWLREHPPRTKSGKLYIATAQYVPHLGD